jgi:hypothetical protein
MFGDNRNVGKRERRKQTDKQTNKKANKMQVSTPVLTIDSVQLASRVDVLVVKVVIDHNGTPPKSSLEGSVPAPVIIIIIVTHYYMKQGSMPGTERKYSQFGWSS